MKTEIKTFLFTIMLTAVFLSCSKNDEEQIIDEERIIYQEQNFFNGFLDQLGFTEAEFGSYGYPFQFGLSFTPLVDGTINSFVAYVPYEEPYGSIKLWEKSTGMLVYSKDLNLPENYELTVNVDPISLSKDKEYIITLYALASNFRYNFSFPNADLPIVEGDIQINYFTDSGHRDEMPSAVYSNFYYGDLSFNFQRTQ